MDRLLLGLLLCALWAPAPAADPPEQAQQLYVAYYGRPADPEGLDYWRGRLEAADGDWTPEIVSAFGDSAEFTERFGVLDDEALIHNLYRQLFNRAAEPSGLAYYLDLLHGTNHSGGNDGQRQSSLAAIALDIANGARNADAAALANKREVAGHFTAQVRALAYPYRRDDIEAASAILAAVGADPRTVAAQKQAADAYLNRSVRLSGTLRAGVLNATDSDVNDPAAPYAPNDGFDRAQALPSPVRLGGFVNLPRSGSERGRAYARGDPSDFYALTVTAGETILLELDPGPAADADVDLYLYDPEGDLLDASLGVGRFESLVPPQPGRFFLEVRAYRGASGYRLQVAQQSLEGARRAQALRLSDAFVPGEIVVRLRAEQAEARAAAAARTATGEFARALGLVHRRGGAYGRSAALFALDETTLPPHAAREAQAGAAAQAARAERLETLLAVKALRRHPEVAAADPNALLHSTARPDDPLFGQQWSHRLMDLEPAWDLGVGSAETVVAVIDTGIATGHPDLGANLVAGYDFISDPAVALDGDGIDPDPTDPGDRNAPDGSSSYHGSHVTGILAADSDNGAGVAGVAWNVSVMPLRVLGHGGGTLYDLLQALRYAAGMPNDSGTLPARRATIVNLSLATTSYSSTAAALARELRAAGVFVIAAAGNDASSRCLYPACFPEVFSVSAVGPDGTLASYSSFNAEVDLAAPGGDMRRRLSDGVLSTVSGETGRFYTHYQGTSMAAPHVSGVIALMLSIHPALRPDDLDALLRSGEITAEAGAAGRDDGYGWGLLDAAAAVQAARALADPGPIAPDPRLGAVPGSLAFGPFDEARSLTLANDGGGELSLIADPEPLASWIAVTPVATEPSGLGTYLIEVRRRDLAPGEQRTRLLVDSTAGDLEIPIEASVRTSPLVPNAGRVHVRLTDADSGALAAAGPAAASGDASRFELTGVPAGRYRLVAGSDNDGDGAPCGLGDSCGAFPSAALAQPISVGGSDRSDLDFRVGYPSPAP